MENIEKLKAIKAMLDAQWNNPDRPISEVTVQMLADVAEKINNYYETHQNGFLVYSQDYKDSNYTIWNIDGQKVVKVGNLNFDTVRDAMQFIDEDIQHRDNQTWVKMTS